MSSCSQTHAPGSRVGAAQAGRTFDFTGHMRRLCAEIAGGVPQLDHVRMDHVAVAWAQAKIQTYYGLHASLTPLRFAGGRSTGRVGRREYAIERLCDAQGREYLYILTFYLPRFLDLSFPEKLTTVFHELWHISPQFDGDLRRHPGRCFAHTHSQKEYDGLVASLARQWLASGPAPSLYDFLQLDFATLYRSRGRVGGVTLRRPKLIPLS